MYRRSGWWGLLLWGSVMGTSVAWAEPVADAPREADLVVIAEGAVSRAVGVTLFAAEGQGRVVVEGFAYQEVTAWLLS